jgi:hypothetical protein
MTTIDQVVLVEKAIDQQLSRAFEDILPNIIWLWDVKAWNLKGVKTWELYFKVRFPNFKYLNQTDRRKSVKVMMKAKMTNRAMAVVLGVSEGTIRNDLAQNYAPQKPDQPKHQDQTRKDHGDPEKSKPEPKSEDKPQSKIESPSDDEIAALNRRKFTDRIRSDLAGSSSRIHDVVLAFREMTFPLSDVEKSEIRGYRRRIDADLERIDNFLIESEHIDEEYQKLVESEQ